MHSFPNTGVQLEDVMCTVFTAERWHASTAVADASTSGTVYGTRVALHPGHPSHLLLGSC